MSTLADRIRWILRERKLTQRGLAKAAGLGGTHVNTLLKRLDADPHRQVENETIRAIAEAGRVDAGWLLTGEGDPTSAGPISTRAPRYPNLLAAIDYLRGRRKIMAETEDVALSFALHSPRDLDESTWIAMVEDLDRKLRSGKPLGRELTDADLPPPPAARRDR